MERLLASGQAFAALTVEQLTREGGIARATFYLHFKDKGELVQRLMRRLTAEVVENAGVWFTASGAFDQNSLRFALRGIIATFKKHQAVLAAVADTAPFDPAVRRAHLAMMDELCRLSRKSVQQVRRDGRAAPEAGQSLADALTWAIELYCARFISNYDGRQLDALVDLFAHICGRAIFGDPRGSLAR